MEFEQAAVVLEARGLRKTYKNFIAVKGLDLSIAPGECLALLGPNGAGKTTSVEMLEGLIPPDAGQIRIFGKDLAKHRQEIMEDVGALLQETQLYKRLTVHETLALFASFFKETTSIPDLLKQLGLHDKSKAKLMQLSGGQRQRVYIGCALINNPKLLFLDEPTTGLDPQARRFIWELLQKIKQNKRSILLTTHYMEEAETLADRVAIMEQGSIIACDTPTKLIQKYCGPELIHFVLTNHQPEAQSQFKHMAMSNHPGLPELTCNDQGCTLYTNHATEQAANLFKIAEALNNPIQEFQIRRGTLEDVFLALTGRTLRDE